MTDINLLKDTQSSEEKRKKNKPFLPFDMTRSEAEKTPAGKISPKPSAGNQGFGRTDKKEEERKEPQKFGQPKGEVEDIFAKTNGEKKEKSLPELEYTESETEKLKQEAKSLRFSFFKRLFSRWKKLKKSESSAKKSPAGEKGTDKFFAASSAKANLPSRPEYSQPLTEGKFEAKKEPTKAKSEKPQPGKEEADESFLVNLLPEELIGREEPKKKLISLGFISLGAIFLVILAYFALAFYQSNIVTRTQKVREERVALDGQIMALKDKQNASIAFKQKLDAVKGIINQHVYWSKFFEKLEAYTIKDVYYTGAFSGSLGASISLSALTKDYASVAEQLIVFQNAPDFIENVTITGAQKSASAGAQAGIPGAVEESLVSFSVSLELVPEIFYKIVEEAGEEETKEENKEDLNTNTNSNLNINTNSNFNLNINTNPVILNTNTNSNLNNNASTNTNINPDLNFKTNSSL